MRRSRWHAPGATWKGTLELAGSSTSAVTGTLELARSAVAGTNELARSAVSGTNATLSHEDM